jgi:hypothetical protein
MKQVRYAETAARLLRRFRDEGQPSLPLDRAGLVVAVDHALRRRSRRRVLVQRGLAVGAAAVLLAVGLIGARRVLVATAPSYPAAPSLTVLSANAGGATKSGLSLRPGMVITAGLRLTAPAIAEVQVGTANGTSLTLERSGDLTVAETDATQRFSLNAGGLRAHVSRLVAGQRFIIETVDAEVEVHGTTFRVAIVDADPDCGGGTRTRVSVTEGVVTVRSANAESRVGANTEWPAGCVFARTETHRPAGASRHVDVGKLETAAATPARPSAPTVPLATDGTHVDEADLRSTATAVSLLATQNDLFAAGVRARREGRPRDAVAAFTQLIDAFPHGPLLESATVQRLKVLAAIDPAAAARAAADYLARFPTGFARADAQLLIVRSSP